MGRGGDKGGTKSGTKVIIKPHKHEGASIAKGRESMLVTKNLAPGESVRREQHKNQAQGVKSVPEQVGCGRVG